MSPRSDLIDPRTDTIAAISTAWGEAGVAIVRVSGPDAVELARGLLRFGPSGFPPPRIMRLAALLDEGGEPIDQVLAVHFPAPRSYTGEDVAEIHTHGGTLVAQLCLASLIARGARVAEPGEFTRRAFLNGRMDLSQAEGVLGVIRSRSEEALRSAARTLAGELSASARRIRDELLTLQGDLEVGLDFPDGEPPQLDDAALGDALGALRASLKELESRCSAGALLREGVRVVLAGRPNVGKSSLLNALLKQDRAIVTDQPGATRDVIEGSLVHRGVPIRLADTAGLRDSGDSGNSIDEVEAYGIKRARAELRRADVCLWVLDASRPLELADVESLRDLDPQNSIIVLNKSDLPQTLELLSQTAETVRDALPQARSLALSAKTGEGVDALKDAIVSAAVSEGALDAGLNVTARQLADIRECARAMDEALGSLGGGMGQDVTASLLGTARLALERLLGMSCDDALLDSIFGRFCVGK